MSDEKFLLEYERLLDKGYCDCNEMNCIDNDSPRRILRIAKNLQQENKELKKQLEIKHNGFMASVEEACELAEENQKLKEMQCTFLGTGCQNKIKEYKIQQREFIDWLGSLVVSDLDVFTEIKVCDVLSKYKEIIGEKDEEI